MEIAAIIFTPRKKMKEVNRNKEKTNLQEGRDAERRLGDGVRFATSRIEKDRRTQN